MSEGVPPPPGGYGLHEPPREPEKKAAEPKKPAKPEPASPPAVTTFRGAAPFDGVPVTAPPSRRWVGLPIAGIVILSLRLLLLCGRATSSPSYNYDPIYVPPTIPTTDWGKLLDPTLDPSSLKALDRVDRVAVAADGTAWYVKSGALYKQPKGDGVGARVATIGSTHALAVQGEVPHWIDAMGLHKLGADGATALVLGGTFDAMAIEGNDAWLVDSSAGTLSRLSLAGKNATPVVVGKLKVSDPDLALEAPIAVDDAWVYVGFGAGAIARVWKKGTNQSISSSWVAKAATAMVAEKGTLYVSTDEGVAAVAKDGTTKDLVQLGDGEGLLFGDVAVAGADVYFTELGRGSDWHVRRVAKGGGTSAIVSTTTTEPRLVARGGMAYWGTATGVASTADTAPAP